MSGHCAVWTGEGFSAQSSQLCVILKEEGVGGMKKEVNFSLQPKNSNTLVGRICFFLGHQGNCPISFSNWALLDYLFAGLVGVCFNPFISVEKKYIYMRQDVHIHTFL